MRSTYYGDTNNENSTQPGEIELTGREQYAKLGSLFSLLSIPSILLPPLMIPLSLAAIVLGILGYKSYLQRQAVRAVVLGSIMLLTGMTLTLAAAMMLPYTQELMDMLSAGMPG